MSSVCAEDGAEVLPLSLVVRKELPVPATRLEPSFEPRKRLKAPERVLLQSLEGRAEEILIEIEPNNLQDEEEISVGDEQLKPDQMSRDDDDGADVTRDVFDIDELSLSVCRQMSGGGLLLGCPFCSEVVPLQDSGRHLLLVHRLSRLTCPGRKCPNRIQSAAQFSTHVLEHHVVAACHDCGHAFNVKSYPEHVATHSRQKALKPTILQPRSLNSGSAALIKPRPLETLLGNAVSDDFEVLLDGKLVIVDGLHFYIRGGVVYVDCAVCSKSTSLSLLSAHIADLHANVKVAECRAKTCKKAFPAAAIQDHIQSQHTRVRCKVCSFQLELPHLRGHDRADCAEKSKAAAKAESEPSAARPTSTGVHFLSHFLDDRARECAAGAGTGSLSPVDLAAKDEDSTTSSCGSSVNSLVGSQSKSNSLAEIRKKRPLKNGDRNGKIPTVPCPYCGKQCSYLNKHIRDVHQPKVHCTVCGKRMGKSYLSEHMKIQHQGKELPTKVCPLCGTRVQKLKNHLKYSHKMSREESDQVYAKFYPTRG